MNLYYYDHCPYCTRVRLVAGIWKSPITETFLLNDDEETPSKLIGYKMVPILQFDEKESMGESLDIVEVLHSIYKRELEKERYGEKKIPYHFGTSYKLEDWIDANKLLINYLIMPRCIKIGLEEFKTESAIEYFVNKKELYIGSFAEHLEKTEEYRLNMEKELEYLATLKQGKKYFDETNELSETDVVIFPLLRNLTMVKGLEFPEELQAYIERLSEMSGVPLFTDRAI